MILPKGYCLKHGTSFNQLNEIYKSGIFPGRDRNTIRTEKEEEPIVHGVSIGKNLSYYGASLAFTSFMHNNSQNKEIGGDVPIVLEIELGEECEMVADENIVFEVKNMRKDQQLDFLMSESERVWTKYESGVLVDQEIPTNWIKTIEYPILRDIQVISENKKYLNCYKQDISVLALAYWQYKTNATVPDLGEMIVEFKKKNEFIGQFTNSVDFSKESIAFINNLNVIKNKSKLNEYAMTLWHEFTVRINQLGLDFRS